MATFSQSFMCIPAIWAIFATTSRASISGGVCGRRVSKNFSQNVGVPNYLPPPPPALEVTY